MAKIESQAGIDSLDSIVNEADGIMIGRGDLSSYLDYAKLAGLQRQIIVRTLPKYCLVSTGFLISMLHRSLPRQAEVCDISNVVWAGASGIQLCEETAYGDAAHIVGTARRIIDTAVAK